MIGRVASRLLLDRSVLCSRIIKLILTLSRIITVIVIAFKNMPDEKNNPK
jgi:hypothetical protein